MASGLRLRESVLHSKKILADGRERIRAQHAAGSRGIQVCNQLTDLFDETLLHIHSTAVEDLFGSGKEEVNSQTALVALGGYGRRDMAPFSDIDLMLLHTRSVKDQVAVLAKRLVQDISDTGVPLGFSVRTPAQAVQLAKNDPVIFTSLVEARYLTGSQSLVDRFLHRFRLQARRRFRQHISQFEKARREERLQYGGTVFLLEPNIKRSRGALREIHLLRWVGFARFGEPSPTGLRLLGELNEEDERRIKRAHEFLLRARNELHFNAGRAYDVLYRSEQQRIAELWNYVGSESVLPVEEFMSEYFGHTSGMRAIESHFRSTVKTRQFLNPLITFLVSHRLEDDFRVGPAQIGTTRAGRERLKGNLAEVLRLMDIANQMGKRIDHTTWNAIREDFLNCEDIVVTEESAKRFMSMLAFTSRLGSLLRQLHGVGVLEKLVTGMDHARCLLQFNRYHKYTVDEHCLRAVERATEFQADDGPLGEAYRSIEDRAMLHLALLIHDLGKGLPGDHSEVGAELALKTAQKLRLSKRKTELLQFLVLKHLVMSHLAFRRDTSDEKILLQFATEVGSPEYMKMLYVLTAADLAAVGPDVLNPWKVEILTEVYRRANYHLKGAASDSESVILKVIDLRENVVNQAPDHTRDWIAKHVQRMDASFLMENESGQVIEDLMRLHDAGQQPVAWGRFLPDRQVTEYSIGTYEDQSSGIFHRVTGALTSQGLSILSASIQSLADGLVLDRFQVEDPDFDGSPSDNRLGSVGQAMLESVNLSQTEQPVFRRTWKDSKNKSTPDLEHLPTRVVIDNSTLPDCTIIDIFAHDRTGLLYTIARTIYQLNLSVKYAKIGTYLDQVVDVFYVNDLEGQKITDDQRLETIRAELLSAIER